MTTEVVLNIELLFWRIICSVVVSTAAAQQKRSWVQIRHVDAAFLCAVCMVLSRLTGDSNLPIRVNVSGTGSLCPASFPMAAGLGCSLPDKWKKTDKRVFFHPFINGF